MAEKINFTKFKLVNWPFGRQFTPSELTEILTSKTLYIKMAPLARATGKPWIKVTSWQANKQDDGLLSGVSQQVGLADPISAAGMLGASKDVRAIGKATIDGVSTTHYHGTYKFADAVSMLSPRLQRLERNFQAIAGARPIAFDAWVDGQNNLRQLTQSHNSKLGAWRTTVTMRFKSINQP